MQLPAESQVRLLSVRLLSVSLEEPQSFPYLPLMQPLISSSVSMQLFIKVADGVAGESVVGERTATNLNTLNRGTAADFEVVLDISETERCNSKRFEEGVVRRNLFRIRKLVTAVVFLDAELGSHLTRQQFPWRITQLPVGQTGRGHLIGQN